MLGDAPGGSDATEDPPLPLLDYTPVVRKCYKLRFERNMFLFSDRGGVNLSMGFS